MTEQRDIDRLLDHWMSDGASVAPDRVIDVVADRIERQPQRPAWRLHWRDLHVNRIIPAAAAVAAIIVIAVVGFNLLPGSSNSVGSVASATPSPFPGPSTSPTTAPPSPAPTPSPRPADEVPFDDVALDPGSYSVYGTHDGHQLRMTFDVPAGWFGHESWFVYNEAAADVSDFVVDSAGSALVPYELNEPITRTYLDPCDRGAAEAVGPTVDELVTALSNEKHRAVISGPTDITVSGYAGKTIEIGPADAIDPASCTGGHLVLWATRSGGERWIQPDLVQTIWIIDVDGQRVLIEGNHGPNTSAADQADLQAMMESIEISVSDNAASVDPASVAIGFMEARQQRRVDEALRLIHPAAVIDWGAGQTPTDLAAGLAWEDAFGITFSLDECSMDPGSTAAPAPVLCVLTTDAAVAHAVGNDPGKVCVAVGVKEGLITHLELLSAQPGCDYQFSTEVFAPFNEWVRASHPESDPDAMYQDRLSPEGLALWTRYTQEFLAAAQSG